MTEPFYFWQTVSKRPKGSPAVQFFRPGPDAIKKFTPSLGIPYLGVLTPR